MITNSKRKIKKRHPNGCTRQENISLKRNPLPVNIVIKARKTYSITSLFCLVYEQNLSF